MVKLTEKLVLARARSQSLGAVKNLNCWGNELTDVTIIQQMHNVEVINASANNIESLESFRYCCNLRELYLRRNNIQSLHEILHLKNLSQLRFLWLSDNPFCANNSKYRSTVLKALPTLQKLDNIVVTPEEVKKAEEEGDELKELRTRENPPLDQPPCNDSVVKNIENLEINQPRSIDLNLEVPSIDRQVDYSSNTSLNQGETSQDDFHMSMSETNKLRQELGLKPMPIRQQQSPTTRQRHRTRRHHHTGSTGTNQFHSRTQTGRNNVLIASLALVQELDEDSLRTLQDAIHDRLQSTRSSRTISEVSNKLLSPNLSNGSSGSTRTSSRRSSVEMT